MICACGYVKPCVPLVENTCKSCGDMTDSLSGVYNLETARLQKIHPTDGSLQTMEIIHAMRRAQAQLTTKGSSHLSHFMGSVVC